MMSAWSQLNRSEERRNGQNRLSTIKHPPTISNTDFSKTVTASLNSVWPWRAGVMVELDSQWRDWGSTSGHSTFSNKSDHC